MSNQAVEHVRGVPMVKTFGQTVFSFKKFKGAIDSYKTWVIAYTKQLRLPMMFYTAAINSAFAFLVAAAFLFTAEGITNQFLLNLLFYIIITPVISTTLTKIMFQSENTMIMEDAPIILLDEAAASLDAENETLIQQAPSQLIQNKPVLIHRPSHAHGGWCRQNCRAGRRLCGRGRLPRGAAPTGPAVRQHGKAAEREPELDAHRRCLSRRRSIAKTGGAAEMAAPPVFTSHACGP